MGLSFCAIDFETANRFRGSPCAVGLVKVIDGREVGRQRWLMRPPEGVDYFDHFNVALHGITSAMVADEPRFAARLPEIIDFADGLPFVAHNAMFDLGVIRDACDKSGLARPAASYVCTLTLARCTYDLLSYSLPWVAEAAGVPLGQHHDAEADAAAAAGILGAIAAHHGAGTLGELCAATGARLGTMSAREWSGFHSACGTDTIPVANSDADPDHPFCGREMVFTGALDSMTRGEAWERVSAVGGQPAPGVTKHTNILVFGYQDSGVLRPGEELSAKARKARDLRERGQDIEIMLEDHFLELVGL